MFQRLYQRILSVSESPQAPYALAAVAFAESSFFPIPPDIMLIPMSLAAPRRAWGYAAIATVASVAGGILGYAIGALLFETIGHAPAWVDYYRRHDQAPHYRYLRTMLQALQLKQGTAYQAPRAYAIPTARPTDRARMVRFPGGTVELGTADRTSAYDNERPPYPATVAPFSIDVFPVTNGDFLEFIRDGSGLA